MGGGGGKSALNDFAFDFDVDFYMKDVVDGTGN
jgi:hypothetical protein